MVCLFNFTVGMNRHTIDDVDIDQDVWDHPEKVEELIPGAHVKVQACDYVLMHLYQMSMYPPYLMQVLLSRCLC